MSNRKNAYAEVYTILQELNEKEYNKIPPEVIKVVSTKFIFYLVTPLYF